MSTSALTPRWKFINWIPQESISVKAAIIISLITILIIFAIMYWYFKLYFWSAFVIGVVAGQLALILVFSPTKMSFWTELNSWTALYGMLWLISPIIVYIFAISVAITNGKK